MRYEIAEFSWRTFGPAVAVAVVVSLFAVLGAVYALSEIGRCLLWMFWGIGQ